MDLVNVLRAHWDRALAAAALLAGVVALIVGYIGVSGTAFSAEQMPYIVSGAVTGLFLLGVAATLYLSADLRDEWRKLDDVDQRLAGLEERQQALVLAVPKTAVNGGSNGHSRAATVRTTVGSEG